MVSMIETTVVAEKAVPDADPSANRRQAPPRIAIDAVSMSSCLARFEAAPDTFGSGS
jgi:hypothetical protein